MPDITKFDYDPNGFQPGIGDLGAPHDTIDGMPDQDPTLKAFGQAYDTIQNQNPVWNKQDILNKPYKTKLDDTLRYTDPDIGFNPFDDKLEYKYADAHPIKTLGNNILQGGAKFLSTALETIATIPLVLSGKSLYDNDFTNGLNDWLDSLNTSLPVYTSEYEANHPILKYLTFWKPTAFFGAYGNAINNLGFTAGAIAGSYLTMMPFNWLGDAFKLTRMFGSFGRAVATDAAAVGNESRALVTSSGRGLMATSEGALENTPAILGQAAPNQLYNDYALATGEGLPSQALPNVTKNIAARSVNTLDKSLNTLNTIAKVRDWTKYNLSLLVAATAEATFEANNVMSQGRKNLEQKFYEQYGRSPVGRELDSIASSVKEVADFTMAANVAFLYLNNRIVWGSMFKPGKMAEQEVVDGYLKNVSKKVLQRDPETGVYNVINRAPETRIGKLLLNFTHPGRLLSTGLGEGIEEGSQFIISEGSLDYANRKYDAQQRGEVADYMKSFLHGVNRTFASNEGWDNIMGGFVGGLFGHVMQHAVEKSRGIVNNPLARLQQQADLLNTANLTGLFEHKVQEAAVNTSLAKDYKTAIETGDKFTAKNLKHQMLFNYVNSAVKANRFDMRIDELEAAKQLTGEEFKKMWGEDYNDVTGKTAHEYLDTVIEKAKNIKKDIDKVNRLWQSNPFDTKTQPQDYLAYDSYKDQLALNLTTSKEYQNRMKQVESDLKALLPNIDVQRALEVTSLQGMRDMLNRLQKTMAELSKQESELKGESELTKDIVSKRKKLKELFDELQPQVLEGFNAKTFTKTLEKLYKYYSGLDDTNNEFIDDRKRIGEANTLYLQANNNTKKSTDELADALQQLQDIRQLAGANFGTLRYYDYLQTDVGQREFIDKIKQKIQENLDKIVTDETGRTLTPEEVEAKTEEDIRFTVGEPEDVEDTTSQERDTIRKAAKKKVAGEQLTPDEETIATEKPKAFTNEVKVQDLTQKEVKRKTGKATVEPKVTTVSLGNKEFKGIEPRNVFGLFSQDKNDIKFRTNLYNAIFKSGLNGVFKALTANYTQTDPQQTAFIKIPGTQLYRSPFKENVTILHNGQPIGILRPADSVWLDGEGNRSIYDLTREEYSTITGNDDKTYDSFMASIKGYQKAYNAFRDSVKELNGNSVDVTEILKYFNLSINPGSRVQNTDYRKDTVLRDLNYKPAGTALISIIDTIAVNEYGKQTSERSSEPVIVNEKELSDKQFIDLQLFIQQNLKHFQKSFNRYVVALPINGQYTMLGLVAARNAETTQDQRNSFFTTVRNVASGMYKDAEQLGELNTAVNNAYFLANADRTVKQSFTTIIFGSTGDMILNINNPSQKVYKQIVIPNAALKGIKDFNDVITKLQAAVYAEERKDKGLAKLQIIFDENSLKQQVPHDEKVDTLSQIEDKIKLATIADVFENYNIHFDPKTEAANATQTKTPEPPSSPTAPESTVKTEQPVEKDLLTQLHEKAGEAEKQADLQYFIDKAGENPDYFTKKYGVDITNQLLAQVTNAKLEENLADMYRYSGAENPSIDLINRELDRRDTEQIKEKVKPKEQENLSNIKIDKKLSITINIDIEDNYDDEDTKYYYISDYNNKRLIKEPFTSLEAAIDAINAINAKNGFTEETKEITKPKTEEVSSKPINEQNPNELINTFIKELQKYNKLERNPFDKSLIVINDEASIQIGTPFQKGIKPNATITLESIASIEKGKGIGKKTLKAITDTADSLGITIELNAAPFSGKGLTKAALIKFYEKAGFNIIPGQYGEEDLDELKKYVIANPTEGLEMVREPIGQDSYDQEPLQAQDQYVQYTEAGQTKYAKVIGNEGIISELEHNGKRFDKLTEVLKPATEKDYIKSLPEDIGVPEAKYAIDDKVVYGQDQKEYTIIGAHVVPRLVEGRSGETKVVGNDVVYSTKEGVDIIEGGITGKARITPVERVQQVKKEHLHRQRVLNRIANHFQRLFPQIKYEVGYFDFAAPARFYKGVAQINVGFENKLSEQSRKNRQLQAGDVFLKRETVAHEFMHPFILALKQSNPQLFNNLIKELQKTQPEIVDHVNKAVEAGIYEDATKNDEALAIYLGQEITKAFDKNGVLKEDYVKNSKKNLVKRFFNWLQDIWNFITGSKKAVTLDEFVKRVNSDTKSRQDELRKQVTSVDTLKDLYIKKHNRDIRATAKAISKEYNKTGFEEFAAKYNVDPKILDSIINDIEDYVEQKSKGKFQFETRENENYGVEFDESGDTVKVFIDPSLVQDMSSASVLEQYGDRLKDNDFVDEYKNLVRRNFYKKGIGIENRNVSVKQINPFMRLQDVSDFIITQLSDPQYAIQYTGDELSSIDELEAYMDLTEPEAKNFREKILKRLEALKDTSNRRLNNDVLQLQYNVLNKLNLDSNDIDFVLGYVEQGTAAINLAWRKYNEIRQDLDNKETLDKFKINRLSKELEVVKQLLSFYEDVSGIYNNYDDMFEEQQLTNFRKATVAIDRIKQSMANTAAELATEWLYPYIEKNNEYLAKQGYTDAKYTVTKDDFKNNLLYGTNKDIGFITFQLGAMVTSRDPVNAAFANTVADSIHLNHIDINNDIHDYIQEYNKWLKRSGIANFNEKAQIDYYEKNYMCKAKIWTVTGYDAATNQPIYGYVEKTALHQDRNYDQIDDAVRLYKKSLPIPRTSDEWDSQLQAIIKYRESIKDNFINAEYSKLQKDPYFKAIEALYKRQNEKYGKDALEYGIIPQLYRGNVLKKAQENFKAAWKEGDLKESAKQVGQYVSDKLAALKQDNKAINLDGTVYRVMNKELANLKDDDKVEKNLQISMVDFIIDASRYSSLREIQWNAENLRMLIEGNTKFNVAPRKIGAEDLIGGVRDRRALAEAKEKLKELYKLKTKNDPSFNQTEYDALKEKIAKGVTERSIWDKFLPRLKKGQTEHLNKQLTEMLNDVFYGEKEFASNIKVLGQNISLNKVGANVGIYTSIASMAFNRVAGVANVLQGDTQMWIEALGGKHYNLKDVAWATGHYFKNTTKYMADLTNPIHSKDTQLALKYDAIQGEYEDEYGVKVSGSVIRRMLKPGSLFFLTKLGEHQIQLTGMLSLMHATKVKTTGGETLSLYDAYVPGANGRYNLRKDVKFTEDDNLHFKRTLHGINRTLNGNYNELHKGHLQRTWYGKQLIRFRKWIYEGFRARWSGERVDYEKNVVEQGYLNFFLNDYLFKGLKERQFNLAKRYKELTPDGKYRVNKATSEIALFTLLTLLAISLKGDPDKKELTQAEKAILLFTLRLRGDYTIYHIEAPSEAARMFDNPSASVAVAKKVLDVLIQLKHPNEVYDRDYGIYKEGDSKLEAKFKRVVPILNKASIDWDSYLKYYNLVQKTP